MYWAHGIVPYVLEKCLCILCVTLVTNLMACVTGWERWNMGMASHKPFIQLASSGCSNWKENHLYAWWHWSVNKSCWTDWESTASNYNGSRVDCSYGFIMVRSCYCFVLTMKYSIHCFNLPITFSPIFYSRSDPTENDSVEGLRPNARGPGLVTFGVSVLL